MPFRLLPLSRVISCLVLVLSCLSAQTYSWRNAEIGGGGFVTGTIFHPTEPGLAYARTDVGGIYRLDSSSNRWIPLNDGIGGLNNEFQHLGVISIGLDPNDPDRVYIATGQYAGTESWKLPSRVYRSSNRGASWTYTTPGFKMAGNGEGRGTGERIAVDPLNGANLFIGTNNAGIWRSSDFGATWARIAGFPSSLTNLTLLAFAPPQHANPGPNRRLYAGVNTLTGQSFWSSDDLGATWVEVPNHPGVNPEAAMMPLQLSFDAVGTLYSTWGNATGPGNYATQYGVWKCSADATTWTSILPPTGQGFFGGISADPRQAGHVVVSTLLRWWPGDEIYRSTDGGTTWSAILRTASRSTGNSPWATPSPHWITDIDIDPHDSERAFFNTGFGLFQTRNLSASGTTRRWTFSSDGLEETVPLGLLSPTAGPPLISVIGDYTGFRHDHLGRSPARGALNPGSGSTNVISGAPLAPATMIRQHSGTTLYSRDAGASWAGFPTTPEPIINGHHRVIPSTDGLTLLWCPPNSPAFRSTDHGTTWAVVPSSASLIASSGAPTFAVLAGLAGTPGTTNASGGDARFNAPEAIALDPAGVRYIADTGNHTIRRIITNGATSTLAGGAGVAGSADATGTNARFNLPAGIAVNANKTVFVADTGNHTIRKISSTGVVTTFAGTSGVPGSGDGTGTAATFNSPTGLALDAAGNLYVADTGNHTIRKISPGGAVVTVAGSPGSPGATDATGSAARFLSPRGLSIAPSGNLYVADTGNHTIRSLSPAGAVTTFAGLAGSPGSTNGIGSNARFREPKSITCDAAGTFHVADSGNHTIRNISSTASVTTVAGLAGSPGSTTGNGATARFSNPSAIVASQNGINLYVCDTNNHTIRRGYQHNTLVPIADTVDANRFYLWDATAKRLLTSSNGGASFTVIASSVNSAFTAFYPIPGYNGHLWARAEDGGLYRSTNFGATFSKLTAVASAYRVAFGKAKPGTSHPAAYIWGKIGTTAGFFRSDDTGTSWTRINNNLHQFGYQNDLAADPRVYGRIYLATSGRGVVVGDIANPTPPPSQPSRLVFDDALTSGWVHSSPAGTSLSSTVPVRRGTHAIAVPAGSGFAVTCANLSLEGFAALAFWVHSDDPPRLQLQVGASRGGIALEAVPINLSAGAGWQRIVVPFADLDLANIADLSGLRIENRPVSGVSPPAFSLDDIELVGLDAFNGITQASITLANLDHIYDGTPKSAIATTQPAGLPVRLTYNGLSTPPTNAGTYPVSATIDDPTVTGTATANLVIAKADATILLSQLLPFADGTPKPPVVATQPPGLPISLTYNGSSAVPSLAGSYTVVATVTDPNHLGSASATLMIRQPELAATPVTSWTSNIAGKVGTTAEQPSSPRLNPNDTSDAYSTNTLQGQFAPITLVHEGDQIILSGSFQLTAAAVAGQGNWFRFGLYDHRGQQPGTATGWLGLTGMGNSLWERTSTGLFSTGTGATQRSPDTSPAPVSSSSPAGNPPIAFEVSATRTANGVLFSHLLTRTDTNAVLMSYRYSDTSPNNNGILGSPQTSAAGYTPTFTTAGFAFSRAYIGTSAAQAQFSNIRIAFHSGITTEPQSIDFPPLADRTILDSPLTLAAASSSGLPVSFELLGGPATLSGNVLTPTGTGQVTVRASQTGNLNFMAAPPVERTVLITKATATVTLGQLNPTYDGSPKPVTAISDAGNPVIAILYDSSPMAPTSAGSYAVTATVDDPVYQGGASATLVIAKAPQSLSFAPPGALTYGDAAVALSASASSGLPVSLAVTGGPAALDGFMLTATGSGTITILATQPGDNNHLAADSVEVAVPVAKAVASVSLGSLAAAYDGLPKAVSATTTPPGLPVLVTYDGAVAPPLAPGSYAVSASVDDPNHTGSATGILTIGNRGFSIDLTGWTATSSSMDSANTSTPFWNPANLNSGLAGNAYATFPPIQLQHAGDEIRLSGSVSVEVAASSKPANNKGLWFRFGLFRQQNPLAQRSDPLTDWLGYCAMANSTPALYERTGSGNYASSIYGATLRTPQTSASGANSTQSSVSLHFTEVITRTETGVSVAFEAVNAATLAKVISLSFHDSTPCNNGLLTGSQSTPADPAYVPSFSAAGFGFSGEYIGTSNASARFTAVRVSYSSPAPGASQTVVFDPIPNQRFGAPALQLQAVASSGLPVSYEIVSGQASLLGTELTPTGVGEVTIRASQPGNIDFLPAVPVDQTFQVAKADATVFLSQLVHTYDGTAKTASATTSPAGLVTDLRYDGSQAAPVDPGSYEVSAVIVSDHYQGSASGILRIDPALSGIESWRLSWFGTAENAGVAADTADPDSDGFNNLLEFALGLPPNDPSANPISLQTHGENLQFTYPRLKSAVSRFTYTVEWSDSLAADSWSSTGTQELAHPIAGDETRETVQVTLPKGNERRFVRLRIVAPPSPSPSQISPSIPAK